jgi:hypothetical protein
MNRVRFTVIVAVVAIAAAVFGACSFEQKTTMNSPSSATTSVAADGSSSSALIGLWASQASFTIPDISTCGGFEWSISSQGATAVAGTFSAKCGGNLTVSGNASGSLESPTTVRLSVSGTAVVAGFAACNFSVSGLGVITNNDTLTIPYSGNTCLGPVKGTETLRRRTNSAPSEPPPPTPSPSPTPAPPASAAPGGFDLANVTVVGSPNVLGWPVTSRITSLWFGGGNIHVDHTRRGQWPAVVIAADGTTQESTLWAFFNINGRWYASGGERFRPGQLDKGLSQPSAIGPGWFYDPARWGPMTNYVPRPGELVGFMVAAGSTRSDANIAVAERSAVILVPFPADGVRTDFPPFGWEE